MVFEPDNWDDAGEKFANDKDLDGTAFEKHYELINSSNQVQIYEAIMGDVDGLVTTTLLGGAVYLKDNRILPDGFDKNSVGDDIAVMGKASVDPDFIGGSDSFTYHIPVNNGSTPLTIIVELLYQSVGYRWALNLGRYDAVEPERFMNYFNAIPNLPILVSVDSMDLGD
jgi:hypothetical protein